MFYLWLMPCSDPRYPYTVYENLHQALDKAKSEALYGTHRLVQITDKDWHNLVSFNAKELRDVARQQRQARELQVPSRVHARL
jgi:hypothetical protein